ncbi:YqjF family protein [Actinoplanes sp. URMC 104]|uniref:YqjF family protein n=1 Tax=Actinoplanes sp. URMC 104 TaxID=3423409 RepID=UPI003F19D6D3
MVTVSTPRPVSRSLLVQRWADLAFLHWPVDPALVAPLLPAGTVPDTFDGVTYAGLIGFRMEGVGFLNGPGVPYLGTFCETNVRLYSVDAQGRRGVVFRSLEAERLLPVLVARATLRLPYMWARMRLTRRGDVLTYSSRRRWPGPRTAVNEMSIRVGEPLSDPSPLEQFLTARWGLHTTAWGRTIHLSNEHPTWPLHRAELLSLSDTLVAAAGLPQPTTPPVSVLYSPGVAVTFGGTHPLAPT